MSTHGIHHITAISSNAQRIFDFYTNVLGLRLVKKTVNFDAPEVYHLYFGDEKGSPGTILTFFPFEDAGTGMRGLGQVTKIYLAVEPDSLGFWLQRFVSKSVKHDQIKSRFSEKYITFFDLDGLQLELVTTKDKNFPKPWIVSDIPKANAIKGFYGAELAVESRESIEPLLTGIMGYKFKDKAELFLRYENENANYAKYLDLVLMKGWPDSISSAGTVHHIAFRVKTQKDEEELREKIVKAGFMATGVVDRFYFKSVYFREKNNILFEIATDEPGFDIDESIEELGSSLKLPKQYEPQRAFIESVLPDLYTEENSYEFNDNSTNSDLNLFKHRFVDNRAAETLVLFHGTGGNELDMIRFAKNLGVKVNILSVRGNVNEHGLNRFFERNDDGSFDFKSIELETEKFQKFFIAAIAKYDIEEQPISFFGYSNGANFALAYALLYPIKLQKLFALHPMAPVDEAKTNLSDTEVIVTYGKNDEYSKPKQIEKLDKLLKPTKAKITLKEFNGGHEIDMEEMEFLGGLALF